MERGRYTRKNSRQAAIRLIRIIDLLAPRRYGMTTRDITRELNHQYGDSWCEKTIRRDLIALEAECMVAGESVQIGQAKTLRWRVAIRRTETLQRVALELCDA